MAVRIGAGGAARELLDPRIGAGGQVRAVQEIREGTPAGAAAVVWFRQPLAASATALAWDRVRIDITPPGSGADTYTITRGSTVVHIGPETTYTDTALAPGTAYTWRVDARRGAEQVGSVTVSATTPQPALALTATPVSSSQIDLAWTALGAGWTYNVDSNPYGRLVTGSAAAAFAHTGVAASTNVAYRVDAFYGGVKQLEAHASATTPAAQTQQRVWTGNAVESSSYNGAGGNRGVPECYYGQYSGTQGLQKSLARWEIPAEIRGCVSVDRVELSWWNLHHYLGSGGGVNIAVHHFHGSLAANNFPGSTAPLRNPQQAGDPVVTWAAPKPGWINGSDWFDLAHLHAAGRDSVAEEIRSANAAGFGLAADSTAQADYGYARGASQGPIGLRITYTVRVG